MRPRERRYLERMRRDLWGLLGRRCALANAFCAGPLEVDHPNGRAWIPSAVSIRDRYRRYLIEARAGEIRALCRYHNRTTCWHGTHF